MSDTMSGTPPRAPTPDPDIEEDRQGLLEFFNVIKVKKLPAAFEQNGSTHIHQHGTRSQECGVL